MLKIDVHTHILPERWPDLRERYGYGGFMQLEHHHVADKLLCHSSADQSEVNDAGSWREYRAFAGDNGFSFSQLRLAEKCRRAVVYLAALKEPVHSLKFIVVRRHQQLAALLVRHIEVTTKLHCRFNASMTEFGFQTIRLVVNTGVNDARVSAGLVTANAAFFFQHENACRRVLAAQLPCC